MHPSPLTSTVHPCIVVPKYKEEFYTCTVLFGGAGIHSLCWPQYLKSSPQDLPFNLGNVPKWHQPPPKCWQNMLVAGRLTSFLILSGWQNLNIHFPFGSCTKKLICAPACESDVKPVLPISSANYPGGKKSGDRFGVEGQICGFRQSGI